MPVVLARLLVVLAACLATVPFAPPIASAQEGPYSSAAYYPPPGWRAKEFTLARKDGTFHLFYLRENEIPDAPTQRSFGHATSRDLYVWTEQDTILPVVEGTFEATQMWAPSLHKIGETYYLFYPGMRHEPANGYVLAQSISYATSTDLYTWTRRETPLFGNDLFPWAYYDTTQGTGRDCRDPFLWWDETSQEWLLFVSTRPAFQPQSMVIGIAGSADLEHWSDRGYLPMTLPSSSFSDVAESPHVFTRDGSTLYLMWTTNAGQQLTYGTTTTGPLTGWGGSRRLRAMLGYSTLGWWASEIVEADGRTYFATVHNTWVDFWDMEWTEPDSFDLTVPDPLQLLGASFDRDSIAPGDTVTITVQAVNAVGREIALEYTAPDSGDVPVDPAPLGLPATILGTGEFTSVAAAVTLPEEVTSLRIAVHAPGSPPSAPSVLAVNAPEPPPPDPEPFPAEDPTSEPVPPLTKALLQLGGEVRFVRASSGFCVTVFDARGRRVWNACAEAGETALVWKPGVRGAAAVRPGVYFARVVGQDDGRMETIKVPLVLAR